MNIQSDETRGCSDQYGAVDDNLSPILEDIEFYQISLTSDDNADVIPEHSVALIFIEDNDGMFIICMMYYYCKILSSGRYISVASSLSFSMSTRVKTFSLKCCLGMAVQCIQICMHHCKKLNDPSMVMSLIS